MQLRSASNIDTAQNSSETHEKHLGQVAPVMNAFLREQGVALKKDPAEVGVALVERVLRLYEGVEVLERPGMSLEESAVLDARAGQYGSALVWLLADPSDALCLMPKHNPREHAKAPDTPPLQLEIRGRISSTL